MITEAIRQAVGGCSLSRDEAASVMEEILTGQATDAQIAALLVALRMKGETVDEICGFAQMMRERATPIRPSASVIVDTCGTGGDLAHTFNISTTAAFVVAGAGVAVAKHGNRAVSSRCGSADLLEGLGVKLDIPPEAIAASIDRVGIGFMFAPLLHGAMKYAIGPRREIGIRTVFNILGPLVNPARARYQVLGVYHPDLTRLLAEVLAVLGTKHALVVHGDGLDELTTAGTNTIAELRDGNVTTYELDATDLGLARADVQDFRGGCLETNLSIAKGLLSGERGPAREIVCLNAAAALYVAGRACDLREGLAMAADSIDSCSAQAKLEMLIEFTNRTG